MSDVASRSASSDVASALFLLRFLAPSVGPLAVVAGLTVVADVNPWLAAPVALWGAAVATAGATASVRSRRARVAAWGPLAVAGAWMVAHVVARLTA